MNEQKLFDAALKHIRAQGCGATGDEAGTCMYKTPDNLKCAFAPAIEKYDSKLEGYGAREILTDHKEKLYEEYRQVDLSFAGELQNTHDQVAGLESFIPLFEEGMKRLAIEWSLRYST